MQKQMQGQRGERFAAAYLREKGFSILAFNYVCREGEIDIIAQSEDYLVFVEVKTRKKESLVGGLESVNWRKQERIKIAAGHYLSETKDESQPRFDVIEVEQDGQALSLKAHIENAF